MTNYFCDADFALSEATEFSACMNLLDLLGMSRKARFDAGARPEADISRGLLVPLLIASFISSSFCQGCVGVCMREEMYSIAVYIIIFRHAIN